MKSKDELNIELLESCTSDVIDYERVESLLNQGAEPLGRIVSHGYPNNLYDEVVDHLFHNNDTPDDFYLITELFLRYGMDISKPAIPYDDDNILNPLWTFAFPSNECVLRTLKLLLDHGLSADDARECWGHAIFDYVNVDGELSDPYQYEMFYDYIRKLMLIASYPHVLNADKDLRDEIWYDHNHYDMDRFRRWHDFTFEVDTSRCQRYSEVYQSVVTIIEKDTGAAVWKFGICLKPEELYPPENGG